MFLARVTGNVVATQKNVHLKGHKLLLVHEINLDKSFKNTNDIIAIDLVDSGIDDVVMVAQEGDVVEQILGHANAPVNTIIIGVVDDYYYNE